MFKLVHYRNLDKSEMMMCAKLLRMTDTLDCDQTAPVAVLLGSALCWNIYANFGMI